jgi:hypothetical protein
MRIGGLSATLTTLELASPVIVVRKEESDVTGTHIIEEEGEHITMHFYFQAILLSNLISLTSLTADTQQPHNQVLLMMEFQNVLSMVTLLEYGVGVALHIPALSRTHGGKLALIMRQRLVKFTFGIVLTVAETGCPMSEFQCMMTVKKKLISSLLKGNRRL